MEEKTEFERLDRKLIHRGAIIDLYQDCLLYTSDAADE